MAVALPAPPQLADVSRAAAESHGRPSDGAPKSELPRWLQIVVFTTLLLALTLLAMWGSAS